MCKICTSDETAIDIQESERIGNSKGHRIVVLFANYDAVQLRLFFPDDWVMDAVTRMLMARAIESKKDEATLRSELDNMLREYFRCTKRTIPLFMDRYKYLFLQNVIALNMMTHIANGMYSRWMQSGNCFLDGHWTRKLPSR